MKHHSFSAAVLRLLIIFFLGVALSACGGSGKSGDSAIEEPEDRTYALGVNGYLWRAALDTLSFMPMDALDGQAGTILTEWYVNPDVPTERLKVNVFVLDQALRADSLRVSVFREVASGNQWTSAPVREGTSERLEDAILTRAREIRIAVIENE